MSARRIFTSISLILVLFCASSFGKFSGGTGEPNDPYLIATSNDLNSIGLDPCDWDKHFLMTADINLSSFSSGISFIGHFGGMWPHPDNKPFEGVFDGDGHRISNLVCRYEGFDNSYGLALFSYVAGEGAEIKNLGISDPCIYGNSKTWYIGALVGVLDGARITNCYVTGGSVHGGSRYVSGLVGGNRGMISGCSVRECNVRGDAIVGAITGQNSDGEIEYCFAFANVNGGHYIGGLVGINKGIITQSILKLMQSLIQPSVVWSVKMEITSLSVTQLLLLMEVISQELLSGIIVLSVNTLNVSGILSLIPVCRALVIKVTRT